MCVFSIGLCARFVQENSLHRGLDGEWLWLSTCFIYLLFESASNLLTQIVPCAWINVRPYLILRVRKWWGFIFFSGKTDLEQLSSHSFLCTHYLNHLYMIRCNKGRNDCSCRVIRHIHSEIISSMTMLFTDTQAGKWKGTSNIYSYWTAHAMISRMPTCGS